MTHVIRIIEQQIENKICQIRKPEVGMVMVNNDPIQYGEVHEERKCTRECSAFTENIVEGTEAFERRDKVYQICRFWP